MRPAVALLTLGVLLVIPACSEDLAILGPTPPNEGVILYIHADFAGSSQAINVDVADLGKVEGPCVHGEEQPSATWSDCVSSVRVNDGWSVTLYRDREFGGRSMTLTADTPSLRDVPGPCDDSFNDCVSSLRVVRR